MANRKRRCRVCKDYVLVEDMLVNGVSAQCKKHSLYQEPDEVVVPVEKLVTHERQKFRVPELSVQERRAIHKRDGKVCRLCGKKAYRMEVHHVKYRSEKGCTNDPWNLILLCEEHHQLMHSNKKAWQPVLLACLWKQYVEGERLTVLEALRVLLRPPGLDGR